MTRPPATMGAFEFAVLAALRAEQLTRGCRPRVSGGYTTAAIARREIAEGKVRSTASVGASDAAPH
jgi:DNA-directed RNA polymerase subunit K/omega